MKWETIAAPIVVGLITGVLGYIFGRPKNKAETRELISQAIEKELSSLKSIILTWKEHAEALEDRVEKQDIIIKKQEEVISDLQARIEELSEQINIQCNLCQHNTDNHERN